MFKDIFRFICEKQIDVEDLWIIVIEDCNRSM